MQLSRRRLIGGSASLVGAGAVATFVDRSTGRSDPELSNADLAVLDVPLMLSVTDSSAGEFEILVGEQAIVFTDRPLAARLARAARQVAV